MKEQTAKRIVWFITILLTIGCLYMCLCKDWDSVLSCIPMLIFICPFFQDRLLNKSGSDNNYYIDELRIVVFPLGVILSLYVVIIISTYMSSINILDKININISMCLLKIFIYLFYLVMLWVFKRKEKRNRYIIFGFFYCLCVLLSYSSKNFSAIIINFLNILAKNGTVDEISYQILIECILNPIKESILTFIIFDTIIPDASSKNDSNYNIYNISVQDKEDKNKKDYTVLIKENK